MISKEMAEAVAGAGATADKSAATSTGRTGDSWINIQKNTFTNWVNTQLPAEDKIEVVEEEFKTGVKFIQMLESVSKKPFGRYNKSPRIKHHQLENLANAFKFIEKEGLKLVNIQAEDINDGNLKLILGLLWTIIYHYQVRTKFANAPSGQGKKAGFKDLLLEWVRSKIPEYNIKNFNKDWNDGRAICALVNAVGGQPDLLPNPQQMSPESKERNCRTGIEKAKDNLGIPALINPADMANPAVDDLSIITYVSYFKGAKRTDGHDTPADEPAAPAGWECHRCNHMNSADDDTCKSCGAWKCQKCQCQNEKAAKKCASCSGWVCDKAHQNKKTDPKCTQCGAAQPADAPAGGSSDKKPWERDPNWRKYEGPDLGGRCKIVGYYSTTTSSHQIRSNTRALQDLLMSYKVHERPDFKPWTPIDVDMTKEQRDLIFKKAGTRVTPMLFIDDEYIGDWARVQELNETGQLQAMLEY